MKKHLNTLLLLSAFLLTSCVSCKPVDSSNSNTNSNGDSSTNNPSEDENSTPGDNTGSSDDVSNPPVEENKPDDSSNPSDDENNNPGEDSGSSEDVPNPPIEEDKPTELQVIALEMTGTYGDSFIIKFGNFEILVDAGTTYDKKYVQDALTEFVEDDVLDVLMVSHLHADHIGSMTSTSFFTDIGISVNTFIDPGTTPTTATATNYVSMRNSFVASGSEFYTYYDILNDQSIGTVWYLDEQQQAYMEFFDTGKVCEPNTKPNEMNDSSIAFSVNYLNNKWLFAGDISSSCESTLVENIKKVNVDYFKESDHVVVKANHHGSNGSNSDKFFAFAKPDIIFITAGIVEKNQKNQALTSQHPYSGALSRMKKYTSKVYWSSINGLTTFTSTGNEVTFDARGRTRDYYCNGKIVSRSEEQYITLFESKWYSMM